MVQGETNTAGVTTVMPPNGTGNSNSVNAQNVAANSARLYENLNGGSDASEKKKKVGNYIISRTIGEGSFAKVRLGYHLITQQMVAVKVINKREVLKRNYLRANLRREASMMQRMQHPHIIQLYEVMETENCYYIVMELIDGIEFVKYLSKKRNLDENETRDYIRQICSAVDHMHKAKVIHRDIKLQNFMLDQNHNLTIIDFGLSNSLDDRDFLNTQCGSPAYAAPEIFAHQDYGPEVDIWSIGVNMYAMLAGKLPFKVENRSKNLAKLHACILKGFEVPQFLSPDCQDLLCRLLDPSPSKRIKMSEIFSHPWINYNSFPIEIIPYKPVVDIKEIRPEIVQYLVNKHDYAETDIIDAIVYRKPIALKAVYYLIEKRLKQGFNFPDPDFNHLLESKNSNKLNAYKTHLINESNSHPTHNTNIINSAGIYAGFASTTTATANGNMNGIHLSQPINTTVQLANGLSKQNSQLLPKRHGVQLAQRSSSQKTVDFKSMLNNLNNSTRVNSNNKDNDSLGNSNNMDSNSPSPDFIAAAMSPIKIGPNQTSGVQLSSASSLRNSRQANYQDLNTRKPINSSNNSINVVYNSNTNVNKLSGDAQSRASAISYTTSQNDRYYMPRANGDDTPSYHHTQHYHQSNESRTPVNPSAMNVVNSANVKNIGSIRSLPSSIYRGSPERSLPRSPDRPQNDYVNNNNHVNANGNSTNNRPTSRISSSRPSVSDMSAMSDHHPKTHIDATGQKYKVINYLNSKRSITSFDEMANNDKQKMMSTVVKNRQLHMGKAKIDLETQPNLNVGVSIKNIGAFLKSTLNSSKPTNGAENLKSFNSLNIKSASSTKGNLQTTSQHNTMSPDMIAAAAVAAASAASRNRQSNLVHRHSNPVTNYSTQSTTNNNNNNNSNSTHLPTGSGVSIAVSSNLHYQNANLKARLPTNTTSNTSTTSTTPTVAASSIPDPPANALPRIKINT